MKKCFAAMWAFALTITMNGLFAAAGTGNLIRNPDFETNAEGQAKPWKFRYDRPDNAFLKDPDGDGIIVRMGIATNMPRPGSTREPEYKYGNVFSQSVIRPKPGTYVYSVKVAPSRKFERVMLLMYYSGADKKTVYQSRSFKPSDSPEPGQWGLLVGEIEVPEGVKSLGYAIELRDRKSDEGHVLIASPKLVLKEE